MQNLYNDNLKQALKADARCMVDGELNKVKVEELALEMDSGLLKLLLADPALKKHFFTAVDDIQVFDKIKFQRFINNKSFLPDSYTAYKNKIGLTDENGNFISESREVVLSWPHKDCVLEGGQDKEDARRDEIFFNEILAPDQIDHLLEAKVLTNFKKYDAKGVHDVKGITYDDNLLIKGNNLLALHSLEKVYAGKVKLIYIDPPYNTGNDSFKYNDRFNHSTWLTFMRNRLETARKLLADDGSIWINIDENELGSLMVICHEIFGRENFIILNAIKRSGATGHKSINPTPISATDFLIGYAKKKTGWSYKITYAKREYDKAYDKFIQNYNEGIDCWEFCSVQEAIKELGLSNIDELIKKFPEKVIRFAQPDYSGVGKETQELIIKSKENPNTIFVQKRESNKDIYLKNGDRILFYKDKLREIDGKIVTAEPITNFWGDIPFQGIAKEGGVTLKKGKKPESLLRRIIEFSTQPNDLVLDFFSGSGTTAAVAHKTKRRFIALEQLDYEDNDTLKRLNNVLKGDKSGISKFVGWKGGGSFVYCELAKCNQNFVDMVMDAKDDKALTGLLDTIKDKGFISYKVDKNKFDGFETLSFDDKKKFLIELLDKNMLYVNLSEIEDKDHGITNEDIQLNRLFYSLEKQQQAFAD